MNPNLGDGSTRCGRPTADGTPCRNIEVEGLDGCLQHVDDEYLEEAEEVTGMRRCRRRFGQPDACRHLAVAGTVNPPLCVVHGANAGSGMAQAAAGRVVEGRVTDRSQELLSMAGERLLSPPPIGNPLDELLQLAAEAKEWKAIMLGVVAYLFDKDRIRSSHSRVGEQLRAEIVIYERAIDRLATLLIQIGKLGIEARLAQIDEEQFHLIQTGVEAALAAATAGLPDALDRQQAGRQVLRRALKQLAA